MSHSSAPEAPSTQRWAWLPPVGSKGYYLLLAAVAILVLGPLGGVTAAYMNFSLGFFVGGQVLAGILGSAITYGYGAEGKHGANYMQTMAASVAGMSGMAVLIQAMTWLGMELPPAWQLMIFMCCIGMFGVGLGMLYTPILVDRMQLEYPSGHAVANILRALTDKTLLRRSISKLGGGTGLGILVAGLSEKVAAVGALGLSSSTIGAGMVVGSRIGVPAIVTGALGYFLTPWLREIGWLGEHDPFRKIGFLIALAMILGAGLVDLTLVGVQAVAQLRARNAARAGEAPDEAWKHVNMPRLLAWVAFWAVAIVVSGTVLLNQPVQWMLFAIALSFIFVFINGISCGISDSNPISSAFVISVLLMSALGLSQPLVGLLAASILLISTSTGVDMQQDRSTGWRLGTPRTIQFRYQVIGIVMGAVLCVVFARVFMAAYPVLAVNSFANPEADVGQWQSAMTYKFVGAIGDIGKLPAYKITALLIGLGLGLVTEIARKLLARSAKWQAMKAQPTNTPGFWAGWTVDAVVLPSPYASSFGGFVEWPVAAWFAVGSVISSVYNGFEKRAQAAQPAEDALPEDMSTTSLLGGGLIAGESLYYLAVGIIGLLALVG